MKLILIIGYVLTFILLIYLCVVSGVIIKAIKQRTAERREGRDGDGAEERRRNRVDDIENQIVQHVSNASMVDNFMKITGGKKFRQVDAETAIMKECVIC
jgi:hypothetical protein